MKPINPSLHAALISGAATPEPRILAGNDANPLIIPCARIVYYEVREGTLAGAAGRLGAAELICEIDNSDGAYTNLADIRPRAAITTQEGARVLGIEHTVTRHSWVVMACTPSAYGAHPATLRIEARNGWEWLAASSLDAAAWTAQPIGEIVDALCAQAGLSVQRDDTAFWSHRIDWHVPAGQPYQPIMGALMGHHQNALCRAYGRFEPDGVWTLRGIGPNPPVDATIGLANTTQARKAELAHLPSSSRIVVHGHDDSVAGRLPDLDPSAPSAGSGQAGPYRIVLHCAALHTAALSDRLRQEAIEQRESCHAGMLDISPDLRLQLWDCIALHRVSGVPDGSCWRISGIHYVRKPGAVIYTLAIRRCAATETYDPDIPTSPGGSAHDTLADNFDTYGNAWVASPGSGGLHWLSLLRCEDGEPVTLDPGASYSSAHVVEGQTSIRLSGGAGARLNLPHVDLTAEGRFGLDDFVCLAVYADSAGGDLGMIRIAFHGPRLDTSYDVTLTQPGWTFVKVRRAQFDPQQDWTDCTGISIQRVGATASAVWVDDLRIVRATPNADTECAEANDTGGAWQFIDAGSAEHAGEWHICQDTPGVPFALAQMRSDAGWVHTAWRTGNYAASNHFACGCLFREPGDSAAGAGLIAFATSVERCYRLRVYPAAQTIELARFSPDDGSGGTGGAGRVLASAPIGPRPIQTGQRIYLGLARDGATLNAYLSTESETLFSANHLLLHVVDTEGAYLAGRLGVESHGLNTRFFYARAGASTLSTRFASGPAGTAPAHAFTAEFAYFADPHGHAHTFEELQDRPAAYPPEPHTHPAPMMSSVRVYHSGPQPTNDDTVMALPFDRERWDTGNLYDAAQPTRLTCREPGVYLISGAVSFAANATGRRYLDISLNGGTMIARQISPAAPVGVTDLTVSTHYQLNAGDYVELRVLQQSGGVLNIHATPNYSPEFGMTRVTGD